MASLAQLEACTNDLVSAVKNLADYCRNGDDSIDFGITTAPQPLVPLEAPSEALRTRRSIMASLAKIQILLAEPPDFLQQLAGQVCSAPSRIPENGFKLIEDDRIEPAPRLPSVAWRIPGAGMYTPKRQRCFQGRCRSCRRSRNTALPSCPYDGDVWLSS